MKFLHVVVVVMSLACAAASSAGTPTTLTIAGGACSGVEIDDLNSKFSYTAELDSLTPSSCSNSIRLSKFYIQGACIKDRNNQISLNSVKELTCSEAKSNDQSTCTNVFSQGPSDALLTVGNLTNGQTFDTGNVCANQKTGYIFVSSNCTTSADVTITFKQQNYDGAVCLNIAGTHLSGWAIGIIVVGICIALLLVSWMFWCCCCGSCCCL
jgi:hypothetical protein